MTRHALVTIEEAATLIGMSVATVRRWVAAGHLSAEPNMMRGRAKLYRAGAVYEAERVSRRLLGGR